MRPLRIILGIAIWAGLLVAGVRLVDRTFEKQGHSREEVQRDVLELVGTQKRYVDVESIRPVRFVVGDPVFGDHNGQTIQVGEIAAVFSNEHSQQPGTTVDSAVTHHAQIVLYDSSETSDVVLTHYTSPDSLAATIATLLPGSRRDEIADEIRKAVIENREEIVAALKPLVEKSVRESVKVVEEELRVSIRRHREELTKLGAKYQRDLVTREVVPLVREELIPIVRKHAEPVAEEIGSTLWDKVSLWRFGWRYLYDKSPLPERDRVRKEWKRFMEKEVVPEFESRSDEIVGVVQRIFSDAAKNKEVRAAVRRNLGAILDDPEVHRIVWQILREVMIDSPRVREVLADIWTSPEAQEAFQLASARFEPTAVKIGELLFGTPEGGITPEFAAVLRRQILLKDQRWLLISERGDEHPQADDPTALTVLYGGESEAYPGPIRGAK